MFLIKQFKVLSIFLMALSLGQAQANDLQQIFESHQVVPDVIARAPKQLLKVTYDSGVSVDKGAELTPTQVQNQPVVEWEAESNEFYTLIMSDPDAPSRAEPKLREIKHWLVGNIPGNALDQGHVIAAYRGSGPPQGTGLHRYIFLLYKQNGKLEFDEPYVSNRSRATRIGFKTEQFAAKYSLGEPVAANFYQAQWDEYVPVLQKMTEE